MSKMHSEAALARYNCQLATVVRVSGVRWSLAAFAIELKEAVQRVLIALHLS